MNQTSWDIAKPILAQGLRDVLRIGGAALLSHGVIKDGAGVESFIGAGMTLGGLFWGWWTTSGYLLAGSLLQKLTDTASPAHAVEVAKEMPPAAVSGAAEPAKEAVSASAAAKAALAMALLLGSFLALQPAPAEAQIKKPQVTGNLAADAKANLGLSGGSSAAPSSGGLPGLSKFMNDLAAIQKDVVDGVIADIQAADMDASTIDPNTGKMRDEIAHACYPAEVKFLESLPTAAPPTGKFVVVQLFQKKRNFIMQIQAGLPTYLKLGCAPLLGDEAAIFTKSVALVGVKVGLSAILPGAGTLAGLSF